MGLSKRLSDRRSSLDVTDEAKALLAHRGYAPAFGARPLKRLIQREIGDMLALALLQGRYGEGDTVVVDTDMRQEESAKKGDGDPVDGRVLVLR